MNVKIEERGAMMELKDFIPIPKLEECKSILCIQPHPDDNEIGAGATIAGLAAKGCRVVYLTVTNGNMGSMDPEESPWETAEKRRKETLDAAGLLGVAECIFLDHDDGSFMDAKKLCRDITAVIRKVRPDMVMTADPCLPYEFHPDHLSVGIAAAQACIFSPFPHFDTKGCAGLDSGEEAVPFQVKGIAFYSTAFPNTFINADETWELKMKAIEAHKSQFDPDTLETLKLYFDFKARSYAAGLGFERAEAFKVLTASHLHMNVDTIRL